ncbi:MAG: hypothetical protein DMG58_36505 [Acidobacteria bacterium]|nr:MAG: hypothetical protein DMG58_36505 [Acidobacteriota bacterium]
MPILTRCQPNRRLKSSYSTEGNSACVENVVKDSAPRQTQNASPKPE